MCCDHLKLGLGCANVSEITAAVKKCYIDTIQILIRMFTHTHTHTHTIPLTMTNTLFLYVWACVFFVFFM